MPVKQNQRSYFQVVPQFQMPLTLRLRFPDHITDIYKTKYFAFSKTHIHVNVTGLNFTGFVEIWGGSKVSSSFIII